MAAAPINPTDLGALAGATYSGSRRYPFIPGVEGSGVVVEVGAGLRARWLKGQRVACSAMIPGDGTWAEYMVTSAYRCTPLRRKVTLEMAAMLLVNPFSALAIFDIAKRGRHHAIVSTAAASALGRMILRLGKRYGIPVVHVVRRQAQVELISEMGGEHVLNSSEPGFVEQLRTLAQRLQATLFLDAVGGIMTQQLAEAAPFGSTILLYSPLSSQRSSIDSLSAAVRDLHFQGWFLPNWLRDKSFLQLFRLSMRAQALLGTDLQSPVHKRLPLAAAQEGVEMYMRDMTAGKILLVANPLEVRLDG
jgi:NADPH:quinone reductase-like Zn-dependent oxidoreductase